LPSGNWTLTEVEPPPDWSKPQKVTPEYAPTSSGTRGGGPPSASTSTEVAKSKPVAAPNPENGVTLRVHTAREIVAPESVTTEIEAGTGGMGDCIPVPSLKLYQGHVGDGT
jgi:hypothetical protein